VRNNKVNRGRKELALSGGSFAIASATPRWNPGGRTPCWNPVAARGNKERIPQSVEVQKVGSLVSTLWGERRAINVKIRRKKKGKS
jgi:transcription elongation factor